MTAPIAFGLISAIALAGDSGTPKPLKSEAVTLTGEVVKLTDILNARAVVCDAEPLAGQVVVKTEDETCVPLLSDDASRALFLDKRLRGRPAQVQARRFPGLPYVQVISFQVEDHGHWHAPEYYCEICTISVRFPQTCPCCQGPMELRMKPDGH